MLKAKNKMLLFRKFPASGKSNINLNMDDIYYPYNKYIIKEIQHERFSFMMKKKGVYSWK